MAVPSPTAEDSVQPFHVERRGLEPVPDSQRHGRPRQLYWLWAAALADFFSFFAGAILINPLGLGVADGAAVLILGAVAGAALLGPLGVTGARTGLPQIMYSRLTFGRRGAAIGGVLTACIAIGWFAYDCAIAVQTARSTSLLSGTSDVVMYGLLVAMVAGCIAVGLWGHRTITLVQSVQAPAFLLVCAGVGIALWSRFDLRLGSSLAPRDHVAALLLGFTATFALLISWATYAGDYSRYLPRRSGAVSISAWSGAGSMTTLVLCGLLGLAVQSSGPGDSLLADPGIIVGHLPTWFAWVFVVFIVVAEMSSNYLNIYTAALSALACGVPLRRWQAAVSVGLLGGGVAALVLARSGQLQITYYNFLTATYIWFPAWCVVVLVDYARRRGRLDAADATSPTSPAWRWPAVGALVLGSVATFAFYNASALSGYSGFATRLLPTGLGAADVSSIVGVTASAVLFVGLSRVAKRRPTRRRPAAG